jgi:hypothetical protein
MGGNAMALRAVLPCMLAAMSACDPEKLLVPHGDLQN